MADKRISDFPAAAQWHPDAFIPQDNPAGITEKVTPAQVETKLAADGFVKASGASLGQVAAYTAGGWAPIKLADANIDAAAAIGWGKISKTGAVASDIGAEPALGNPGPGTWYLRAIDNVRSWVASIPWGSISKTGAVASDVGALPVANPTATGLFTAPAIRNTGGTANALVRWDSDGDEVASGISDDGDDVKALSRVMYARLFRSAWAASDTPVGGSSLGVVDAETAWTKGWMLQLGASNTLDIWNYASSTWIKRAQILPDGSLVIGVGTWSGSARSDRWFATSPQQVSGTTSATEWFSNGTGVGSPTIPANYMIQGRRVKVKAVIVTTNCAADSAPEISVKLGGVVVASRSKSFTIAANTAISILVDLDIYVGSDGGLNVVGHMEFNHLTSGAYYFFTSFFWRASWDISISRLVEITLKPSGPAETWTRSISFIEA